MTMGPGEQVWERFGHNAIWIHDAVAGTDIAYNYGLFDFHQQDFLPRFIRGQMWYWMAGFPAQPYVQTYVRANRSVWLQQLDLPPAARLELQRFLEWNARPENRFYHYDYYKDNCSTRVRDALDRVIGGRIQAATVDVAHRKDLSLPHPASHRQRPADLHRPASRTGARRRPPHLAVGGDVPAARAPRAHSLGADPGGRRGDRSAGQVGANAVPLYGARAARRPAPVAALVPDSGPGPWRTGGRSGNTRCPERRRRASGWGCC